MNTFLFKDIFETFRYPVGEPHVQMKQRSIRHESMIVVHDCRDWNDIGQMIAANSIALDLGVSIEWCLPYLPFGRHDRTRNTFDGFTLMALINVLDAMDMTRRVFTIAPHSNVSGEKFRHISMKHWVDWCLKKENLDEKTTIIVPDQGARDSAKNTGWLDQFENIIQMSKVRDPETGRLSGFEILSIEGDPTSGEPVIFDDICDGGGTFLGIADLLRSEEGPLEASSEIGLFTPHGFYTKGIEPFENANIKLRSLANSGVLLPDRIVRYPSTTFVKANYHDNISS